MNPLVFMILFAERELEIQRQKYRDQRPDRNLFEPAPRPRQKDRERSKKHARHQKPCECS
jgi:hypothetical protein